MAPYGRCEVELLGPKQGVKRSPQSLRGKPNQKNHLAPGWRLHNATSKARIAKNLAGK